MSDCNVLVAGDPALISFYKEEAIGSAAGSRDGNGPAPQSGAAGKAVAEASKAAAEASKAAAREIPAGEKTAAHVRAEQVLRSFNTWAFKREQPTDPQLMLQVIAEVVSRNEPVSFVLYWGKGPRCRLGQPDIECLDYLATLGRRVREAYAPGAAINLIFTDTHAELNGHSRHATAQYFAEVDVAARQRAFATCWLGPLTRAAGIAAAHDAHDGAVPEDTLLRLSASASKWYRGDGSAEQGAVKYYQMNMIERRAVELAFPRSIFVTFNGSELRNLFPKRLPVFHMYSLRRGMSVKPWFLPNDAAPCDTASCQCVAAQS
jgi:hypothetical protein